MLNKDQVCKRIYEIITDKYAHIKVNGFGDDLMDRGFNSMTIIDLIVEIEIEFQMEFKDDDLTLNNFKTINNISDYIVNNHSNK